MVWQSILAFLFPLMALHLSVVPEGGGKSSDDDGGDGGGSGEAGAKGETDYKALYEASKAEADKVAGRLAKLEGAAKKREEAERQKAESEEVDRGKAKDIISQKDQALASAKERLEQLEQRERERADKAFAKLPKELQASVEHLKEKLDVADWVDTVDKLSQSLPAGAAGESGAGPSGRSSSPPPTGAPMRPRSSKDTISAEAAKVLRDNDLTGGKKYDIMNKVERIDTPFGNKFRIPVEELFRNMVKGRVHQVTLPDERK